MFCTSKYFLFLLLLSNLSEDAFGQTDNPLTRYKWKNRLIIISTSSEKAQEQIRLLNQAKSDFEDRDLLLIQLTGASVYINSKLASHLDGRTISKIYQMGEDFECILIGKDGGVKQRYEDITNPEHFFDIIDQMPMRRAEKGK